MATGHGSAHLTSGGGTSPRKRQAWYKNSFFGAIAAAITLVAFGLGLYPLLYPNQAEDEDSTSESASGVEASIDDSSSMSADAQNADFGSVDGQTATTTELVSTSLSGEVALWSLQAVEETNVWMGGETHYGREDIQMNLVLYEDGWACEDMWVEYRLDRQFSLLTAEAGYLDDSPSGTDVVLTMWDENENVLYENNFTLGETEPIEVDISGAMRLKIHCRTQGSSGAVVGLGRPTLVRKP
jgi:hypothetical protein